MFTYLGQTIVESPHAIDVRISHHVRRWPGNKRRKRWCVERRETRRPAAFFSLGICYMHPDLVAKLKAMPQPVGAFTAPWPGAPGRR